MSDRRPAVAIEDDITMIAYQEAELVFDRFDLSDAWNLGSLLRNMAGAQDLPVAVDVRLHSMPAFYAALAGSTPDNEFWVRRKRNLVLRFFHSSYAIGRKLAQQETSLEEKFGLSSADYAAHGGSFPITVRNVGCIGAVTVSGLPQRDDHRLVVEALCVLLDRNNAEFQMD
jgi:uncharacterized protein (UPF0303 family)